MYLILLSHCVLLSLYTLPVCLILYCTLLNQLLLSSLITVCLCTGLLYSLLAVTLYTVCILLVSDKLYPFTYILHSCILGVIKNFILFFCLHRILYSCVYCVLCIIIKNFFPFFFIESLSVFVGGIVHVPVCGPVLSISVNCLNKKDLLVGSQ